MEWSPSAGDEISASTGWKVRNIGDRLVCLPSGRQPRVVHYRRQADSTNWSSAGAYSSVARLGSTTEFLPTGTQGLIAERVQRLWSEGEGNLLPTLERLRLALSGTPAHAISDALRTAGGGFFEHFPMGSFDTVEMASEWQMRTVYIRAAVALKSKPDLLRQPEFSGFPSSIGLMSDETVGLKCYVAPLLMAIPEHVWGISSLHPRGQILLNLGQAVPGPPPIVPPDVSSLFRREYSQRFVEGKFDRKPSTAFRDSAEWYVSRLNIWLDAISDPSRFPCKAAPKIWDPEHHFAFILTVGAFFRTLESLLVNADDPVASRSLLFDSLDSLEELKLGNSHQLCSSSFASKVLAEVETAVPPRCRPVLLPRCRIGAESLALVEQGFSDSMLTDGRLRMDTKRGRVCLTRAEAVPHYLRARRNAKHGFTGGRAGSAELLAAHTGELPSELANLAFLYLIALLSREPPRRW